MNETKLTPRQQKIIDLLAQRQHAKREQIAEDLTPVYPISKPTLARELKTLIQLNIITSSGQGRATIYTVSSAHPLLIGVNLANYFVLEPDQRTPALKSFNFDIFSQLSGLFSASETAELKAAFKPLPDSPNRRELERFVIELSWKSSKIEGNTYSLLETETLIKDARPAPGRSEQESAMILNHKAAFEVIFKHSSDFRSLNLPQVMQLHNTLIASLGIPSGIRTAKVGISGTTYVPPDNPWQLKENLQKTLEQVNHTAFPLEKALIISAILAYLQPFADGNKRTARMLTNAVLLAHKYYPLSYRSVDENEYKQALILFFETNNLYHLKRILIDQYHFALDTYFL